MRALPASIRNRWTGPRYILVGLKKGDVAASSLADSPVRMRRSIMRWYSDGFEIACLNSEISPIAFTLDACDREAITWAVSTAGVTDEIVCNMMLVAVEWGFADCRDPPRVEVLAEKSTATLLWNDRLRTSVSASHPALRRSASRIQWNCRIFGKTRKKRLRTRHPGPNKRKCYRP